MLFCLLLTRVIANNHILKQHHIASSYFEVFKQQQKQQHLKLTSEDAQNITLINELDILYFINVSIGTPPQYFQLQLDSGSGLLWVQDSNCATCAHPNKFNSSKSSTYVTKNIPYDYGYGIGKIHGHYSFDTITLPNTNLNITMKLLVVDEMKEFIGRFQGLMGISNKKKFKNIFELGYSNGELKSPLYAVHIRQSPKKTYLYYDEFNPEILGNTTWIPVSMDYMWGVKIYGMFINDHEVTDLLEGGSRDGVMDSGASCIWVDQRILDYLWLHHFSKICNGENSCPCSSPLYPTLTFYFQGAKVVVSASKYLFELRNNCYPCFRGQKIGAETILGDPVLQTYIAIMDKPNQQLGLYQAKQLKPIGWFVITMCVIDGVFLLLILLYIQLVFKFKD